MAVVEDKISFILYGSYEEQLDMLTDEQTGKLLKAIYVYARTGEKHSDDPMVAMMLSVISHQMDIDARKYAESRERRKASASKAGKISAEKRAMKKAAQECEAQQYQPNATNVNDCQRFQHVYVDDDVDEDVDVDVDVDVLNNYSGDGGVEEVYAHDAIHHQEVITIFDEYPSTQAELDKFTALADELFVRFAHRKPTKHDLTKVFEYSQSVYYYTEDDRIVVLNEERADMLRYAFKTAANADKLNWSYIEGIYTNFRSRGITCMDDIYRDNWEYYYGPITA
jgi:hypothetical protein